jgi:hypothetical protein
MRGFSFGRRAIPLAAVALCVVCHSADAGVIYTFTGADGLSAEAEFDLINSTTVQVRLKNTSTGVPVGFTAADQLLTGVSWDAGTVGINGSDPNITGGTIFTGPTSFSLNFSITNVGPNTSVGGEWGYSNIDGSGLLPNFISGNATNNTLFGGPNLDGPANPDGPQAGLYSAAHPLDLGGLGAIEDELIATITLNVEISSLDELLANGTLVEFGSSGAFVPGELVPAPGAALLLSGLLLRSRRRHR